MPQSKPEIILSVEQKRVVWRLRTGGPAPRIALARELGIHNAVMTRLSQELIALGVIEEVGASVLATRGRPSTSLDVSSHAGYAAGATVHPGWLELALVDFAGHVIVRDLEPFDSPDPAVFADVVNRRLRGLAMNHGIQRSRFLGLGVAATGPLIAEDPRLRLAVPWLKGWRDIELEPYFSERLQLPVRVENDATLAALAEYYQGGLIRSTSSALVFFIGHGVGGGLIFGRAPLRGENGNAGEVGRLFPNSRPRPSGIDLLACLQADGADIHSLLDVPSVLETHGRTIRAWVDRAAGELELAIEGGIAWLDPGAIVLSGALPEAVMNMMGDRLRKASWATDYNHLPKPSFYVSRLGSWAVPIGAALLPIHEIADPA